MDIYLKNNINMPANATYFCEHKMLHHRTNIVCYHNKYKTEDGRYISDSDFHNNWQIINVVSGKQNSYDIHWIVAGKTKEVIKMGTSMAVVKYRIDQLKKSTHRSGLLIPVKCK